MADNVAITAGSGTNIATDDVSSVHYQKVKLDVGGDGASVPVSHTSGKLPTVDSITDSTLVVKTVDFSASQTGQTIWTPASGKKFVITDIVISASATGTITIFDGTDSTTYRVAKLNLAGYGGAVINYRKPYQSYAADTVLKYTTSTGIAGSMTVTGFEV